jgi:hypothetical protein
MRGESPVSALCVDDVKVGRDHDDRQKRAETRRLRMRHMSLAAMTAVGLETPLGQPGVVAASAHNRGTKGDRHEPAFLSAGLCHPATPSGDV